MMAPLSGWLCLAVALFASLASADIYLHVPRGSNNRLNERSAARKNANRMFDSQNNNRGGYNVGDSGTAASTDESQQYRMVPDVKISDGKASFQVSQGGVFVARTDDTAVGMIVGVTIACIVVVAVVVGLIIYFRRHPSKWQAVATNCRNAGRSFQSKV